MEREMVVRTVDGKRKRSAKPQEERRADLLDAAAAIFSRDGVADAKVEDITEYANVSKGTFYLYFESKDVAAAAVWRRHIDEFIRIGEAILADETIAIGARLVRVFESLMQFTLAHAALHRSLYGTAGADTVKSSANQRLIALIGQAAQHGVDIGELQCDQPDLLASTLFHGLCGSFNDASRSKSPAKSSDALIWTARRLASTVFGINEAAAAMVAASVPTPCVPAPTAADAAPAI
ncbi:MAG TPA: TetR/AcrR family transcriptional regulator [Kofleriaceae bacterium]|nr:TetR/AcrR family transcriptional regulator [Kofleriaceae bacterium]